MENIIKHRQKKTYKKNMKHGGVISSSRQYTSITIETGSRTPRGGTSEGPSPMESNSPGIRHLQRQNSPSQTGNLSPTSPKKYGEFSWFYHVLPCFTLIFFERSGRELQMAWHLWPAGQLLHASHWGRCKAPQLWRGLLGLDKCRRGWCCPIFPWFKNPFETQV